MTDEIREKVKSLLDEDLAFSDDDLLVLSGRLNSLKVVELASWLERIYGIDFSAQSFNVYDFESVNAIKEMVEKRRTS